MKKSHAIEIIRSRHNKSELEGAKTRHHWSCLCLNQNCFVFVCETVEEEVWRVSLYHVADSASLECLSVGSSRTTVHRLLTAQTLSILTSLPPVRVGA